MSFRSCLALTAGMVLLGVGCKPLPEQNFAGYIIGASDIKKANNETVGDIDTEILDSIVLLSTKLGSGKIKFCSGAVVPPEEDGGLARILTNHHCFAKVDGGQVAETWIEPACTLTKIHFRFREDAGAPVETATCAEGSLVSDFEADVAKLTINEPLPEGVKPLSFLKDSSIVKPKTPALIVAHPDVPENYEYVRGVGRLPAAAVTRDNCELMGRFSVEDYVLDHTIAYDAIAHTCDLVHGASGSPLLVLEDDEYRIAGTNWGGIKRNENDVFNVATGVEYLRVFLDGDTQPIKERNAQTRRDLDAHIERKRKEKKRVSSPEGRIEKALCGVVGHSSGDPSNPAWVLIFLFLVPIFISFDRRKRF